MRREGIDRGLLLIIVIVVVLAGMVVFVLLSIQTDEVSERLQDGQQLSLLIVVEVPGGDLVTQGFFFQPETSRAALFDIPADTGVVVPSLNRVDAIETVYWTDGVEAYLQAASELLDQPLSYYVALDASQFEGTVDLLEGLPLFVTGIPTEGPDRVLLPTGDVVLDGAKSLQYLGYSNEGETERERVARRQKVVTSLLQEIGRYSEFLADDVASRVALGLVETDLERSAFGSMVAAMASLESDRVITRQIEGLYRRVTSDEAELVLLFPHEEGRWLRESVRQVVENIDSTESIRDENIVIRLEILNGTDQTGLASRTAELYRSYGFDVVSVGNAQSDDVEDTLVIDRTGSDIFARRTADIIRAPDVETRVQDGAIVDVTIILGKDFDSRYVR